MKTAILSGVLTSMLSALPQAALAQDILSDPVVEQLSDQDVDAYQDMLDALRRAARRGPVFQISPERIVLSVETGDLARSLVRVTNTGDEEGAVSGVSVLGAIPGLEMTTTCNGPVRQGDFCEIDVSFRSDRSREVTTAIVGVLGENAPRNFEVPLSISVQDPPPPPPEPQPAPVVVEVQQPPSGPLPRDIARGYFSALSMNGTTMGSQRGFARVSAPRDPRVDANIAGIPYEEVRFQTVTEDERYDPSIPHTESSLPVNRDRILTSDRVIKAVLETPVSNVMCNKVVAMVESDVYSATGLTPLIQAGSRVVGECQQFVGERAGIAWSRIITTDGRSISFQDRMADTNDATGLGGAPGRVYSSAFDKYILPIFSTMIDTVAGVIFATFGDDETVVTDENGNIIRDNSARNEGLRIVTGEARGTAQQIISDIRDVREVAVIPKGTRIDIEILEDIYFRDDRRVVAVADMRFNLEDIDVGVARRDLPENLILVPVAPDYQGATVALGGRKYRLDEAGTETRGQEPAPAPQTRGATTAPTAVPAQSQQTLNDLSQPASGG